MSPLPDDKPAYRVPNVAEIAELAGSNGLVAASAFAGCGGSSTGYRWAGWDVRWANEYHPASADCYEANWPGTRVDRRDAREVRGGEVLEACGAGEVDMLDGSPPCQPFSTSGRRERNWGRVVRHGDGTVNVGGSEDLVGEWVRLVSEARPRCAVMENVRGLAVGKAKGYLLDVLDALRGAGYRPGVRLLDAQWLGVPQRRVRCYVVAFRDDLGLDPVFPEPLAHRYTMADALPWLASENDTSGQSNGAAPSHHRVTDRQLGPGFSEATIDPAREPASTIQTTPDQFRTAAPPDDGPSIEGTCLEDEWAGLPHGGQSDRYFSLVRGDPDAPAATVTAAAVGSAGTAGVTHPREPRKFTIAECRRLCGFPDDYALHGSYADQWARLGNSVPPPMARAVGAAVADALTQ